VTEPGQVAAGGRSVLVTGGNRGIGLAIARTLTDAGHRVTVTHRSGEPPEGLAGVLCDVTDPASVDQAFGEVEKAQGAVEVLVSNAGITDDTLLLRMSDDAFTRVLDANLTGAYRVAKRAARSMLRQRWGRMIFISSVVGLSGGAGQANYSSSKAGLVGLARSVARELGSRNITANVIAPGFVDTEMTMALPEARRAEIIAQVPLRRYAEPTEIASAVAFLASDGAGYITGAVIPIDGGLGMGH
jgi:NAD(P)-dependent dehydrogenase (short-subunit alcohol dehydrogenase family)